MHIHHFFLNHLFVKNAFLKRYHAQKIVVILLSLLIVAYGQPARCVWLCPIAATIGYALFFSVVLSCNSRKKIFGISLLWFALVQGIQLSWMTSIEFQGYYILVVYLIICAGLGAQFGLLASLIPRKSMRLIQVGALAAFWTLLEWSRLHLSCGFSWNPTGLILGCHEVPMQFAALFGVFGLSFWVMLTNMWALKIWRDRDLKWHSISFFFLLSGLPYVFGWMHMHFHERRAKAFDKKVHVALVQTGLLPSEKILLSQRRGVCIPPIIQWEKILDYLKEEERDHWDLIVLPEAALPLYADKAVFPYEIIEALFQRKYGINIAHYFPFLNRDNLQSQGTNQEKNFQDKLRKPFAQKRILNGKEVLCVSNLFLAKIIANFYNAEVLLGLDHFDALNHQSYNSAFLITSEGDDVQRYDKRILLPLAEFLPFDWMRTFTKNYGIYDFFSKGQSRKALSAQIPLSVSICYEETFADVIHENAREGGALLVNLTNDNYYPYSLLPEQHFAHARLRTVENGLPLLRSCNTGVTAVIDSMGRVVARFGQKGEDTEFKKGVLSCAFAPYKYPTLFSFWGNTGIIAVCWGLIALFAYTANSVQKRK